MSVDGASMVVDAVGTIVRPVLSHYWIARYAVSLFDSTTGPVPVGTVSVDRASIPARPVMARSTLLDVMQGAH
jgi:hypothetical protein